MILVIPKNLKLGKLIEYLLFFQINTIKFSWNNEPDYLLANDTIVLYKSH